MQEIPFIILEAPLGTHPHVTNPLLDRIDPERKFGLALTYDVFKYMKSSDDIRAFTTHKERFLMVYPEGAKAQQQTLTSTGWREFGFDSIKNVNANVVVANNQQFPQFKSNITRDPVLAEIKQLVDGGARWLFVTKLFQLVALAPESHGVMTRDLELAISAAEKGFKVILHVGSDFTIVNQIDTMRRLRISLVVSFQTILAEQDVAIRIEEGRVEQVFARNAKFIRAMGPLSMTCQLECCRAHGGYIRHLLDAHELLGPIYLTMHNIGQLHRLLE